jgi:BON domain
VTIRSDCDIQHQIESELFSCPGIDSIDIAVKVTDGVATLTGWVSDFFDKYDAEEAANRVTGVLTIANDIQVQPTGTKGISDPQIHSIIKRLLLAEPCRPSLLDLRSRRDWGLRRRQDFGQRKNTALRKRSARLARPKMP